MSKGKNTKFVQRTQKKIDTIIKKENKMSATNPLPAKPPSQYDHFFLRKRRRDSLDDYIKSLEDASAVHDPTSGHMASSQTAPLSKLRKKQKKQWLPLPLATTTYKPLIPKTPKSATNRFQEMHSDDPLAQQLALLVGNLTKVKCQRSPWIPTTVEEMQLQNRWYCGEIGMMMQKRSEARALEARFPRITIPCMAGRIFVTNHSAVLACRTMWCPDTWSHQQGYVEWPPEEEFVTEGWDRHKNGFGRFFPVPRTEYFEQRLVTFEWLCNPNIKYPEWNGQGLPPVKERMFAVARGELDEIADMGRRIDEEFIFDRAEETRREEEAGVIGVELWRMIEDCGEEGKGREKRLEERMISFEEWEV